MRLALGRSTTPPLLAISTRPPQSLNRSVRSSAGSPDRQPRDKSPRLPEPAPAFGLRQSPGALAAGVRWDVCVPLDSSQPNRKQHIAAQSKTLHVDLGCRNLRQLLDCGSPLPLSHSAFGRSAFRNPQSEMEDSVFHPWLIPAAMGSRTSTLWNLCLCEADVRPVAKIPFSVCALVR